MFKKRNILIIIGVILLIIIVGSLIYLNQSYSPLAGNQQYLEKENVNEYDQYYHFVSNTNNNAVIFYPGGKVEEKAYAPLCDKLNQAGFSVFLVKMPFNLAVFDKDRASNIIKEYNEKFDNWYLVGHSLGGAMAASYLAEKDINYFSGLVFLASYPSEDIYFDSDNIKALSILVSEDEVMNKDKFTETKDNLPSDTIFHTIRGGNHAGFGNYGPQKGDGESSISREKQWEITADLIIDFIRGNN